MNRPEELQHMRATVEQLCTLAGMPPSWEGSHPRWQQTGSTEEAKIAFNVLALDLNVEQLHNLTNALRRFVRAWTK